MILGIYGYQDSGKTTTVEKLVKALVKDGFKVASVKHTARAGIEDVRGKDTWRHAAAGSDPVALMTPDGAVIRIRSPASVDAIIQMLKVHSTPDVIIIEGFKEGTYPKVSVGDIKPRKGTVMSNPSLSELVAFVKKEVAFERALASLPGMDCHKCGLDCTAMARAIADGKKTIAHCRELASTDVYITVGGKMIVAGGFVSDFVDDTVRGMLSSLKGYEPGKDVEIRLKAKSKGSKRRPNKGR